MDAEFERCDISCPATRSPKHSATCRRVYFGLPSFVTMPAPLRHFYEPKNLFFTYTPVRQTGKTQARPYPNGSRQQ